MTTDNVADVLQEFGATDLVEHEDCVQFQYKGGYFCLDTRHLPLVSLFFTIRTESSDEFERLKVIAKEIEDKNTGFGYYCKDGFIFAFCTSIETSCHGLQESLPYLISLVSTAIIELQKKDSQSY